MTYQVVKGGKTLAVRRPDWSEKFVITVNGKETEGKTEKGYVYLEDLKDGDEVTVLLDDEIKRIYASSKVAENSECVAIQRGPLAYCAEGADNGQDVLSLSIKENGKIKVTDELAAELLGAVKLEAEGYRIKETEGLYSMKKPQREQCQITMIPYYAGGNRGLNQMRVWLPER